MLLYLLDNYLHGRAGETITVSPDEGLDLLLRGLAILPDELRTAQAPEPERTATPKRAKRVRP